MKSSFMSQRRQRFNLLLQGCVSIPSTALTEAVQAHAMGKTMLPMVRLAFLYTLAQREGMTGMQRLRSDASEMVRAD